MGDLPALEDGKNRSTEADQRAAAHRRRTLRQRLELQPRTTVVEQDAAVEIAHHHTHRQFRHQGGEPVLFLFHRGLGQPDLRLDVGQQFVTLLRQIVGGARQFAHLGRAFGCDAEIAVGPQHQAQGFRHAQQAVDILLKQGAQQLQTEDQAHDGDETAYRQPTVQSNEEAGALLDAQVGPQDAHGQQERPGHQQTEHDQGEYKTGLGVHASSDLIWSTRSLVENGFVI